MQIFINHYLQINLAVRNNNQLSPLDANKSKKVKDWMNPINLVAQEWSMIGRQKKITEDLVLGGIKQCAHDRVLWKHFGSFISS